MQNHVCFYLLNKGFPYVSLFDCSTILYHSFSNCIKLTAQDEIVCRSGVSTLFMMSGHSTHCSLSVLLWVNVLSGQK